MKQNKFDISFQIGPWNLESLICNTHTCVCTHTHTQISADKGNGYGNRLGFLIGRIFSYMSILFFWLEHDAMENTCKDVRSWQAFPWQAVAFCGGIGKNVCRKSFLTFNDYGREKEENKSIQNMSQRKIFFLSDCPDYLFTSIG